MKRFRFVWMSLLVLTGPLAAFSYPALRAVTQREPNDQSRSVLFFDITDLPARIDEPKLRQVGDSYRLNCAVANRSNEQLLGMRLILMIVDREGKLRTRVTWSEESALAASSIKTFEFRPPIKNKIQSTDRLFLSVDEAIGRETIWHAVDVEKALRAYSRGQHDLVPKVRTVANKDDREPGPRLIPKLKREQ
ncbi:MAG: hypothetical protein ACRDRT_17950 [Pseudonocardiaceae bacterium]